MENLQSSISQIFNIKSIGPFFPVCKWGKKIPLADICTGVFQNLKEKLTAAGTAGGAAAATTTITEGFGGTD
jgi:hypothetical protein